ncbi:hypothetical protein JNUCC75_04845 [Bifidobacterium polysaccharolyticum]
MSETETAACKSLAQAFYDQVFTRGDTSNIDRFMRDDYIQHNSTCADGKAGFLESIKGFLSLDPLIGIIEHNVKGVQSHNGNGLF